MPNRLSQAPPNADQLIIAVAFTNPIGDRVQLLYPASRLLNLAALERRLGGHLLPQSMAKPLELQVGDQTYLCGNLEAIPALVDAPLMNQTEIQLTCESGLILTSPQALAEQIPLEPVDDMTLDLLGSLPPPSDAQVLGQKIHNLTGRRVQRTLADTLDLPALPQTAVDIVRLKLDPNASLDELAQVIGLDPSMAAQVVSWANSPYYAAPGQVKSVQDAVIRVLGYDMVMNLALGLSLGRTLDTPSYPDRPFGYWEQSVLVAACMERLAKAMPPSIRPNLGEAYLTGLLHNFGDLLLAHLFEHLLGQVERTQRANPHLPSGFIDQHLLGLGREDVGGELLSQWQLPSGVCQAIQYQHRWGDAPLAQLLFVTLRLLDRAGAKLGAPDPVRPAQFEALGLSAEQADTVIASIFENTDELKGLARTLNGK